LNVTPTPLKKENCAWALLAFIRLNGADSGFSGQYCQLVKELRANALAMLLNKFREHLIKMLLQAGHHTHHDSFNHLLLRQWFNGASH
jgi:hypothetical protein